MDRVIWCLLPSTEKKTTGTLLMCTLFEKLSNTPPEIENLLYYLGVTFDQNVHGSNL